MMAVVKQGSEQKFSGSDNSDSNRDSISEKVTLNSKSLARIGCVQVLYISGVIEGSSVETAIQQVKNYYKSSKKIKEDFDIDQTLYLKAFLDGELLEALVYGTVDNIEEIDSIMSRHLFEPWTTDKLHPLLKAIIRSGICELKFFPNVSYKIVINDFVKIATEMLSNIGEVNFVNAILDKVYKHLSESQNEK